MSSPNTVRHPHPFGSTFYTHTHTPAMTVIRPAAAPKAPHLSAHRTPPTLSDPFPRPVSSMAQVIAPWMSPAVPSHPHYCSLQAPRGALRRGPGLHRGQHQHRGPRIHPPVPGGGTLPDSWVRGPAGAGGANDSVGAKAGNKAPLQPLLPPAPPSSPAAAAAAAAATAAALAQLRLGLRSRRSGPSGPAAPPPSPHP